MRQVIWIILLMVILPSCKESEKAQEIKLEEQSGVVFNYENWNHKEGKDYPHRPQLLNSVLYNDSLRTLSKQGITNHLGDPDREQEGHLYYLISQTRLGLWPLHTRTIVVKLDDNDYVEWIKLHE